MSKKAHKKGPQREIKEFDEQVVQIDRVTRVVKGGRKLRFRATVVIGNRKGKVGIGIGKSNEVTGAIQKAIAKAKRNLIVVPLDNATIPHDTKVKFKASRLMIMPASPGTGIIAGGSVRKVVELAGIKDILSKSHGSTNKVNNTKVAIEALKSLKPNPAMELRAKKRLESRPAAPKVAPKAPQAPAAKAPAPKKSPVKKETTK